MYLISWDLIACFIELSEVKFSEIEWYVNENWKRSEACMCCGAEQGWG